MVRGDGTLLTGRRGPPRRRFSESMIDWQSSMQSPQIYTSLGPSTNGPTSRWLFRQNEQYAFFDRPALPVGRRPSESLAMFSPMCSRRSKRPRSPKVRLPIRFGKGVPIHRVYMQRVTKSASPAAVTAAYRILSALSGLSVQSARSDF
jgi:hypothetical protein